MPHLPTCFTRQDPSCSTPKIPAPSQLAATWLVLAPSVFCLRTAQLLDRTHFLLSHAHHHSLDPCITSRETPFKRFYLPFFTIPCAIEHNKFANSLHRHLAFQTSIGAHSSLSLLCQTISVSHLTPAPQISLQQPPVFIQSRSLPVHQQERKYFPCSLP